MKYKGEPTKGIVFFNLLYSSDKFCSELGKFTLAIGKLEAELILYFLRNNVKDKIERATLGKLISIGEKNNLFDRNLSSILNQFLVQRNELTHNVYSIFIDLKKDSILDKDNLLDSDVWSYIDFLWQAKENVNNISEIIRQKK
ncbi:hypothetical protein [Tenacibaculum haliotis]|uniref:hypothetical protein n=1 Tax=Tenacibaculum haliotis TaxID=1888914 RepID=UPI0021AFBC99|nr:hypothetical protein [Tenacibaculum haliotis]MCT4698263.1 hypothetical protein [Tenacibaculum haliotis]